MPRHSSEATLRGCTDSMATSFHYTQWNVLVIYSFITWIVHAENTTKIKWNKSLNNVDEDDNYDDKNNNSNDKNRKIMNCM